MTYPNAIIIAAAILAGAIFMLEPDALSAASNLVKGPYQIAAQSRSGNVWVIDTMSGTLRLCLAPKLRSRVGQIFQLVEEDQSVCLPWIDAAVETAR